MFNSAQVLGQFQSEFHSLISASLAENTKMAYNNSRRVFEGFCVQANLAIMWPPPLSHLVNFVLFLSHKGVAPSTARAYIAGLSFYSKCCLGTDNTTNFLLKKLLEGMKRSRAMPIRRAPITIGMLQKMPLSLSQVCSSRFEAVLFLSAFLLAFFGLLRVGELAVCKGNGGRVLQVGDISFKEGAVELTIRFSKTDQMGHSTKVVITQSDTSLCPVKALKTFLDIRPKVVGPLYCHINKEPVTRYQFATILQKSLKFAGYDISAFKTHSFRIGGATHAAMQGLDGQMIQKLGRWKSDVYKRYVRVPGAS